MACGGVDRPRQKSRTQHGRHPGVQGLTGSWGTALPRAVPRG